MKPERLQKLAASRNVSTNRDLFTSMDFETMHISVKPRLLLKNGSFRQMLKVS